MLREYRVLLHFSEAEETVLTNASNMEQDREFVSSDF